MKAILEFDLDNPDDKEAHLRCVKATNMACALFEIQINLKKKVENYIETQQPKNNYFLLDEVFTLINGVIEDNDINIDELIS